MKLIEKGRDPPAQFFDQPEVPDYHEWYWIAFGELSTERQVGMSLGPIPRSAIFSYAAEYGLFGDEAERFNAIIREVDQSYIAMLYSKDQPNLNNQVAPTDIEGSKQVMDRLIARASLSRVHRRGKS